MTGTAYLEIKSQHSRGSSHKFGGPDKYVVVQIVPDNQEPLSVLNHSVAAKSGIKLLYFGMGYSRHTGPRSFLGKAIAEAKEYVTNLNIESLHNCF